MQKLKKKKKIPREIISYTEIHCNLQKQVVIGMYTPHIFSKCKQYPHAYVFHLNV